MYGAMSFLAAAFVYFYVPETKRRTLEEMQNLWMRGEHALPATPRSAIQRRSSNRGLRQLQRCDALIASERRPGSARMNIDGDFLVLRA